jgi:uncharacterized membrane protein
MRSFLLPIVNIVRGSRNTVPFQYVENDISSRRLETLVDGVFAIALTLLVLEIKVPRVATNENLTQALIELTPKVFAYFLSFVILGLLWFGHQTVSHYVKRLDRTYIFLNLSFLLSISVIPFSAALLGEYLRFHIAATIYGINLFVTGLIQYFQWEYMSRKNRLIDSDLDRRIVRELQKAFLTVPLIYGLAIGVSTVSITAGLILYGVVTVFGAIRITTIFHRSHNPTA